MKTKVIGTVTAGLLAASAAVFGTTAPALAASRSEKCVSWACGSATFTYVSKYKISPISMSIKDPLCNGSLAYVRLRVHYANGTSEYTTKHNAYTTCDAGYKPYNGLSFTSSSKIIRGVEVYVGDGVNGQQAGNYVDNPQA